MFLFDAVCTGCVFLETRPRYSSISSCPVCWHLTVHSILLGVFIPLWYFSSFICYFVDLGPLAFFVSLARVCLTVLSKKPALGFIDLFHCVLTLYFSYFLPGPCYFFPSADFYFAFSKYPICVRQNFTGKVRGEKYIEDMEMK